ncbi:hypothetical protein MFIFM68171_08687 [Madurella fahalii]|uniref:Uncharacterized protein n=1 Tax=Madurella fahalii TaxID=1157608 RepID=A0ABQ0GL27_9PEZI
MARASSSAEPQRVHAKGLSGLKNMTDLLSFNTPDKIIRNNADCNACSAFLMTLLGTSVRFIRLCSLVRRFRPNLVDRRTPTHPDGVFDGMNCQDPACPLISDAVMTHTC